MGPTRVLVIGSGGREHALVWKLASERAVADIVCAPGNAGISGLARCIPVDAADPHALEAIARREEADFTIIGPELPLSRGVADVFAAEGLLLFGPTQRAARLESSKVFAKEFMHRCNVPTARYRSCDSAAQAVAVLRSGEFGFPVVLKADGLAAGKGVVIAKDTPNFIANRVGAYGFGSAMQALVDLDLTIEEVDAPTGPPVGRPK